MQQFPDEERLHDLEAKWLNGTITPDEAREYADWYNQGQDEPLEVPAAFAGSWDEHRARMLAAIRPHLTPVRNMRTGIRRIAVAAAVAILMGAGGYYLHLEKRPYNKALASIQHDVAPGRNAAVLTIAGGRQIVLDSTARGMISRQGNTTITNANGQLAYTALHEKPTEVLYNTLTTNRGNQYQLILPDGSKVWLNAASSITYPTIFSGSDRQVQVSGEVYFEIAKDKSRPFLVKVQDMEVEVLGTHFNIMAYSDEGAVRTTLLEGSVKVTTVRGGGSSTLKPGQQARLSGDHLSVVSGVNTDEVVSWKDGLFDFERVDLQTILRQLSRWYNVDVVYEGTLKNRKFGGIVKRNSSLKYVLDMLQDNDIVYTIDGKKLTIKSE